MRAASLAASLGGNAASKTSSTRSASTAAAGRSSPGASTSTNSPCARSRRSSNQPAAAPSGMRATSSNFLLSSRATTTSRCAPNRLARSSSVSRTRCGASYRTTGQGKSRASSALRRAPACAGRKPAKRKRLAGKPAAEIAAAAALGPGSGLTAMPAACACATSHAPGSDSAGVPASLTSATFFPWRSAWMSPLAALRSLCSCKGTVRAVMP